MFKLATDHTADFLESVDELRKMYNENPKEPVYMEFKNALENTSYVIIVDADAEPELVCKVKHTFRFGKPLCDYTKATLISPP